MLRKTIIALVGVAALGSAAFAQEIDGDGNPVPGVSVNQPAPALERSFAGPQPAAPAVTAAERAFWDRQSIVH
jgi:hypothetical protein